jgi:hypothetical protein
MANSISVPVGDKLMILAGGGNVDVVDAAAAGVVAMDVACGASLATWVSSPHAANANVTATNAAENGIRSMKSSIELEDK